MVVLPLLYEPLPTRWLVGMGSATCRVKKGLPGLTERG
ncbi:hypothetical protein SAMN03097719_0576 [Pantoea ananatis]|nr:hypothetical protein SAMN03097719_0576 [Pantoea ananatis]